MATEKEYRELIVELAEILEIVIETVRCYATDDYERREGVEKIDMRLDIPKSFSLQAFKFNHDALEFYSVLHKYKDRKYLLSKDDGLFTHYAGINGVFEEPDGCKMQYYIIEDIHDNG